jgi:hypothetical protein
MQLRAFLFLLTFLFCSTMFAQTPAGVWEGSFLVNGNKKQKMNVRIELMEQEGGFVGVINTRGFDKNTVYGCDYIVTGAVSGGSLRLKRKDVRRGVNMSNEDCIWFRELDLRLQQSNSGEQLKGVWLWMSDEADQFTAVRSQDSVSEVTKDEITAYVEETYRMYEENNVLLPIVDRLNKKVADITIDSGDIVLDFTTDSVSVHDSIAVVFNGQVISASHNFKKAPLRIRLKELAPGANDLVVISQSVAQNKLTFQLVVSNEGKSQQFTIHPGFTRNEVLFLHRKQE